MNHDQEHEMTHEKAIAEMTAERYLLNELNDADAEAFERHFFDCRVCADTVRAGWTMFDAAPPREEKPHIPAAQPAVQAPVVVPFRKRWSQWVPTAAAAALASVVTLQVARPPAPPMMQIATPGGFITGIMRAGEKDLVIHFDGKTPVEVIISPDVQQAYPQYRVELQDAAGKVLDTRPVKPEQVRQKEGVPVLLSPLPAGRYVLAILGVRKDGSHTDVAKNNVVVQ